MKNDCKSFFGLSKKSNFNLNYILEVIKSEKLPLKLLKQSMTDLKN